MNPSKILKLIKSDVSLRSRPTEDDDVTVLSKQSLGSEGGKNEELRVSSTSSLLHHSLFTPSSLDLYCNQLTLTVSSPTPPYPPVTAAI